jgi:hypothetical protein
MPNFIKMAIPKKKDEQLMEKLFNLDTEPTGTPLYPQKNLWSASDANVCELFGDGDELLATFGREGVTVYNPKMEIGKGKTLYLHQTHGTPTLVQWDSFKIMAKAVFGFDLIDRDCPNFLQRALAERDVEHVEE